MLSAARGGANKHILVPVSVILLDFYYKTDYGKEGGKSQFYIVFRKSCEWLIIKIISIMTMKGVAIISVK